MIGGWLIARLKGGPRFDPAPRPSPRAWADWRKGKSRAGAGGGGEDGVPEPPPGVPADTTGQPRLHHRLRPHYRRCGEQLQLQLLIIRAE